MTLPGSGGCLFKREFFLFHSDRMRQHPAAKPPICKHCPYEPMHAWTGGIFPHRAKINSVVQDNAQKGIVNADFLVFVLNES